MLHNLDSVIVDFLKLEQDNIPHCPVCDNPLNCHSGTNNSRELPMSGDVSICLQCVTTLVYDIQGSVIDVRLPSEEERIEIEADEGVMKIKQLLIDVKNKNNKD